MPAVRRSGLPLAARIVARCMCDIAGRARSEYCYAGAQAIQRRSAKYRAGLPLHERSVHRALRQLEEAGLIRGPGGPRCRGLRNPGGHVAGGAGRATIYRLLAGYPQDRKGDSESPYATAAHARRLGGRKGDSESPQAPPSTMSPPGPKTPAPAPVSRPAGSEPAGAGVVVPMPTPGDGTLAAVQQRLAIAAGRLAAAGLGTRGAEAAEGPAPQDPGEARRGFDRAVHVQKLQDLIDAGELSVGTANLYLQRKFPSHPVELSHPRRRDRRRG